MKVKQASEMTTLEIYQELKERGFFLYPKEEDFTEFDKTKLPTFAVSANEEPRYLSLNNRRKGGATGSGKTIFIPGDGGDTIITED